jgi:uncharacterized protein
MKTAAPDQSLTDEEFNRLSNYLDEADLSAMDIEMIDGFFAALICGPEPVAPGEYLPHVWGKEFAFESEGHAHDFLGLLLRHQNAIADGLARSLDGKHVYMPVLLEDKAGIARGNDWARGFMRGMSLRLDSWADLVSSEEYGGSLIVIMMLYYQNNPDPAMRPPPIPDDKRDEIHAQLAASLAMIYRYFEPHRRDTTRIPQFVQQRRVGPKVGRNDPCPCGSGRKHKHCCASGTSNLH